MQGRRPPAALVAGLAFALAFVFGAVANRVNFCTMGAVTDVVNFGDWRRMRMWLLAIAVAIAGAASWRPPGWSTSAKTIYTGAKVPWLSHLVGGFLFGFGMTLASGCGSKTLIRAGAGNLKSRGRAVVLGDRRVHDAEGRCSRVWRATGSTRGASTSPAWARRRPTCPRSPRRWARARPRSCGCRSWSRPRSPRSCSRTANSARRRELIVGGLVVGLVIVGGWYVSGHLGYLAEDPATLEEKFVATNSGRDGVVSASSRRSPTCSSC